MRNPCVWACVTGPLTYNNRDSQHLVIIEQPAICRHLKEINLFIECLPFTAIYLRNYVTIHVQSEGNYSRAKLPQSNPFSAGDYAALQQLASDQ